MIFPLKHHLSTYIYLRFSIATFDPRRVPRLKVLNFSGNYKLHSPEQRSRSGESSLDTSVENGIPPMDESTNGDLAGDSKMAIGQAASIKSLHGT